MVVMEQVATIRAIPLFSLPRSTKEVLSDLLNIIKVIPTDGPEKLFRDWRGLCALANISSEVQASIYKCPDKTGRVLDLWSRDSTVLVGDLLDSLQKLDRFDVFEDVCIDLVKHLNQNQSIVNHQKPILNPPKITISDDSELITYDDRPGYKHQYDAYVLHADEDKGFVDQLTRYLENEGFEICTKDKLLPGHATLFGPVSKLISERCQRIVLVYSPEFLISPANTFFRDYAQAVSIESRTNKTIPVMYRWCVLPAHLAVYHMLHYRTEMYDFWAKLAHNVNIGRMLRLLPAKDVEPVGIQSSHSAVNIVEMTSAYQYPSTSSEDRLNSQRSVSVEVIGTSSPDGSITSETSDSRIVKKKPNLLKTFYKKVTGKKAKKVAIMMPS